MHGNHDLAACFSMVVDMVTTPDSRQPEAMSFESSRDLSPADRGSWGTRLDRDLHLFDALFGGRLTASLQIFDVQSDRLLDVP